MGFRFRKSIKILPGLKLNLTHKGITSASIGKPGASLNIGYFVLLSGQFFFRIRRSLYP